ncbi:MAG: hypothetical protein MI741_11195, partial [Rhodospirillales bacterium]|nr:hypothetical protein [Rhodospirillales bacterium]
DTFTIDAGATISTRIYGRSGNDIFNLGANATISGVSASYIDGGSGTDTVNVDFNGVTLDGTLSSIEVLNYVGDSSDNTIDFNSGVSTTLGGMTVTSIDAGGGADTIILPTASGMTISIANAETITGGAVDDTVTVTTNLLTGSVIDLMGEGEGSDSLTLAAGSNVFSVSNVEDVLGSASNDTWELENTQSGGTVFDMQGGSNDILDLSDGSDNVTINDVEKVFGGAGTDTVILSGNFQSVEISEVENLVGSGANDAVNLADGSGETVTVSGTFNTIGGGGGTDTVNISDSGFTLTGWIFDVENINGGAASDTVTLGNGGQTVNVSDIETLNGGTGDDVVTLTATTSGMSINLGTGTADSVTLADGTNSLSIADTETITGGSGSDSISVIGTSNSTITGGGGGDSFNLLGGGNYTVQYTAATDGSAAGAATGYDTISSFDVGTDLIFFSGALATLIDDKGFDGTLSFATSTPANFTSTHDALLLTSSLSESQLVAGGFADLLSAINGHSGVGVTAAGGDDGLIVVQGASDTAIYLYQENGTTTNNVSADELSLLAVVDNALLSSGSFDSEGDPPLA